MFLYAVICEVNIRPCSLHVCREPMGSSYIPAIRNFEYTQVLWYLSYICINFVQLLLLLKLISFCKKSWCGCSMLYILLCLLVPYIGPSYGTTRLVILVCLTGTRYLHFVCVRCYLVPGTAIHLTLIVFHCRRLISWKRQTMLQMTPADDAADDACGQCCRRC